MRNRERERRGRNTKGKREGRKEGAEICGYGRHPMAKLAGETMAKCQAGPPLRIETGRPKEWHTRGMVHCEDFSASGGNNDFSCQFFSTNIKIQQKLFQVI